MINQELWNTLKKLDPKKVERQSLAVYDIKNHAYTLKICSRDYIVLPEDQVIYAAGSPSELPNFFLQLAAVNYLIGAKAIALDGRWVSSKEFPSGPLFFRGQHTMPTGKIESAYGQDREGFAAICQQLGGRPVKDGDAAFELLVFPRLPIRLILWLSDEEFPARLTYLFDRTANAHLLLDGLWTVGKLIESFLTK